MAPNKDEVKDIEDVFKDVNTNTGPIKTVKIHTTRRRHGGDASPREEVNCSPYSNDIKPEEYNVYMKTWGCSHNTSDGEYMMGLLCQEGYKVAVNKEEAEVWILNSCTVKGPSEEHFKNEVEKGQKLNKKVIVSGCVPQGAPRTPYIHNLSIIGVKQIDQIVHVVEEAIKGNTVRLLSFKKENEKNPAGASLHFPKIRKNELIEIIPISTGCLNTCTYCKTKLARGNLSSYGIEEIVSRANHVIVNEGVKEIWLTSEDLGAWGIDLGLTIVDLLEQIVKVLPNDTMLRLGMTNPPYILDHLEEIAKILNHPRVYSFLHIPLQSASDSVLLEMKREYSIKQFESILVYLKSRVPNLTIATDIICGFPTETEQDFEETYQFVKKHKFPSLYINQFYPRPGTVAGKMKRINTLTVKERTRKLTELFLGYGVYEGRVGKVYRVLLTEIAFDKKHFVGHNKAYEQILVGFSDEVRLGKWVEVQIIGFSKFSMVGVVRKSRFSFLFPAIFIFVFFVAYLLKNKL